jgi:threonine synthase
MRNFRETAYPTHSMNYQSTRDHAANPAYFTIDTALNLGLALDGGLYVPSVLPSLDFTQIDPDAGLPSVAAFALAPFFVGSSLSDALPEICAEALALPIPEITIGKPSDGVSVLELFHGPSAAFKDFAARFLAGCMRRLRVDQPVATVLVATSGDTGGAVAAAFHRLPGFKVVILYPDGRVSARQAHQLSAFGDNILTYKVDGSFDDCQALVKAAFADADLRAAMALLTANSISLGRLLPQMAYCAFAAVRHQQSHGKPVNLIIPSGNLGHGVGAVLARAIGAPIGEIVLAANANTVLSEYFASGNYQPHASLATLANAMDVGAPSNFERLRWLYPNGKPDCMQAHSVSDAEIQSEITDAFTETG